MLSFRAVHPLILFLYYIVLCVIALLLKNPLVFCSSLFTSFILVGLYVNWSKAVQEMLFVGVLSLFIVLAYIVFYHNGATALFFLNDQAVTIEVLIYSVMVSLLVAAGWFLILVLNETLPTHKILQICQRFSPSLGIFLASTIRFIKTTKERFTARVIAQRTAGYFSSASLVDKGIAYSKLLFGSIFWAFEKSFKNSTLLSLRGYRSGKRSHFQQRGIYILEWLAICLFIVAAIIYCFYYNELRYFYFPVVKEQLDEVALIPLLLAILLPLLMELKGWFQWNYYKSKM